MAEKHYVTQRVRIFNTTDSVLDGQHVTILGFYAQDDLILLLDEEYCGNKAIVLTKYCVQSLSNGFED